MKKTILLTGATDGIGLETAKMLVTEGHTLLLHGRNIEKLKVTKAALLTMAPTANITLFCADFSDLSQVNAMAEQVLSMATKLDVLINNAGIFVVEGSLLTVDGMDVRFAVNTVAPYLLIKKLRPIMDETGRVVNLSSAAQMPVDFKSLIAGKPFGHSEAYAQSKLAIIMWGLYLGRQDANGPSIIAVNPKSFLGSKMVETAYGRQGYDLKIGGDILCRAALSEEFANAGGMYFDNDYGTFAEPHPFAKGDMHQQTLIDYMNHWLSV